MHVKITSKVNKNYSYLRASVKDKRHLSITGENPGILLIRIRHLGVRIASFE